MSGRCCRFAEYGQHLWATRLETDYLAAHAGPPPPGPDGVCPYLRDGRCGVRDHRMLGCRVFFCDATYEPGPVYEKYHRRIRELHARHGIPYDYREFASTPARIRAGRESTPSAAPPA